MVNEIAKLLEERSLILDETPDDERVDLLSEKIRASLALHQDSLAVEFIIESLTKLGSAPSILYDDNGHFTIGGDGSQNLPTIGDDHKTQETTFQGCWFVKAGGWKKTIREALRDYFESRE
jgi:hypothetical protein